MAFIQMKTMAASSLERFEVEIVEERGKHEALITEGRFEQHNCLLACLIPNSCVDALRLCSVFGRELN